MTSGSNIKYPLSKILEKNSICDFSRVFFWGGTGMKSGIWDCLNVDNEKP